jgi:hypothetical protein
MLTTDTKEQRDLYFKDEGLFVTVCFMTDKAKAKLKAEKDFKDVEKHVYGKEVLKTDILNESVKNMFLWAIRHGLTVDSEVDIKC